MFVVRYVALVALSIWFSDLLLRSTLAGRLSGELLSLSRLVAYAGGAVVLVGLFAIKFLGPPPRAFPLRAAVVALMLGIVAYTDIRHEHTRTLDAVNVALGMLLLAWYARE